MTLNMPTPGQGTGQGHPIMFGAPQPAHHFRTFPDGGGYPKGFVKWALGVMRCDEPHNALHVCSGSMKTGVRVDVRHEMRPTVVAQAQALPFRSNTFGWVLVDPPYSEEYAENLYGTREHYCSPAKMLREAIRVCRPGGRVGFMHHQVPHFQRPAILKTVYGITQGPGFAIRAWSLFGKAYERETCGKRIR